MPVWQSCFETKVRVWVLTWKGEARDDFGTWHWYLDIYINEAEASCEQM